MDKKTKTMLEIASENAWLDAEDDILSEDEDASDGRCQDINALVSLELLTNGCTGVTVVPKTERARRLRDEKLFGGGAGSARERALEAMATHMIELSELGTIVTVEPQTYGAFMGAVIEAAEKHDLKALRRIARAYEGVPGAEALAAIAAEEHGLQFRAG